MSRPRSSTIEVKSTHAEITLARGQVCKISLEDVDDVSRFGWHRSSQGYVVGHPKGSDGRVSTHRIHRHILRNELKNLSHMSVDHINGDPLDNRRENLRVAGQSLNSFNQRKKRVRTVRDSGVKGVYWENLVKEFPWRAAIGKDYKIYNLGRYATIEEAAAVRRAAELRFFGEHSPEQNAKNNIL